MILDTGTEYRTLVSVPSSELAPPPAPFPQASVCPPTWILERGHTRLRWRGWGEPIQTISRGTLALCIRYSVLYQYGTLPFSLKVVDLHLVD